MSRPGAFASAANNVVSSVSAGMTTIPLTLCRVASAVARGFRERAHGGEDELQDERCQQQSADDHEGLTHGDLLAEVVVYPRWLAMAAEGPAWSAVASLGQGSAQGGNEFGYLPLRDRGGQDCMRPVECAGPLVQLDRTRSPAAGAARR